MAINEKTKITLTIVSLVGLVTFVGGGAWSASAYAGKIETQLRQLREDMNNTNADRFTTAMASEQALRTALANPGMRVPDPRNQGQYFFVEKMR